jgi:hypothetical protein
MRSVKLSGGGDFCIYDHNMGIEVRDQSLLLHDLRAALGAWPVGAVLSTQD